MKKVFLIINTCLVTIFCHAETFQFGAGIAKQRLNTKSFLNSEEDSKGHFDFTSLELRAAWIFTTGNMLDLSLEGQFHQSLQGQASTAGSIDLQEIALSGVGNFKIWQNFGADAGLTFFSWLTSPKKEMENPAGLGVLYGVTYRLNDDLQLRLRREDKVLMNSYDIQPGYSLTLSYTLR